MIQRDTCIQPHSGKIKDTHVCVCVWRRPYRTPLNECRSQGIPKYEMVNQRHIDTHACVCVCGEDLTVHP